MTGPQSVLLIDDNPGDIRLVQEFLRDQTSNPPLVHIADRLSSGLTMLADLKPDIVLLDLSLPDSHGLETFLALHNQVPDIPIVVLSGNENEEMGLLAMQAGADDYLPKQHVDSIILLRTIRHVLARRRAESALRIAEERNRIKSEFMAHMSHEFRTPLNAILGFSQLLEFDSNIKASEPAMKKIGHIRTAGAHLLAMVDDLLDLSRIEADDLALSLETLDLDMMIRECLGLIAPQATARELEVTFVPVVAACHVLADRRRLRQVLMHLLSNAVKYNRTGGAIDISRQRHGDMMELCIRDSGRGLSPEQLKSLFEPFNRLDANMSNTAGTGIGLTIVRQLVKKMNGSIRVTSVPGEGSTFVVALPAAIGLAHQAPV